MVIVAGIFPLWLFRGFRLSLKKHECHQRATKACDKYGPHILLQRKRFSHILFFFFGYLFVHTYFFFLCLLDKAAAELSYFHIVVYSLPQKV